MTKQQLLLVDGDPRTLHVLEASLRGAGFAVMTAGNAQAALARCRLSPPDLVVSDTVIPGMDGFQLCQAIKADEVLKDTPVVFLSGRGSVEEKVRGLELGAEDYLTKPIDTREFVARVRLLIDKREKERIRGREQRASFSGSLGDLSIADLLQTLDIGRKSGTVHLEADDGRIASVWVREGAVIDAASGRRRGEAAFYWLIKWRDGRFSVQFGPVDRPARIEVPTQHLLLEGMRRLDEWAHALARLPPTSAVLRVDYLLLSERLSDLPHACDELLRLIDGRRTFLQVLAEMEQDELESVGALELLLREDIVRVVGPREETRTGAPPPVPAPAPPATVAPPPLVVARDGVGRTPPPIPASRAAPRPPTVPDDVSAASAAAAAGTDDGPRPGAAPPRLPARVALDGDDPPPRIVRFSVQPRMVVVVPPVSVARRRGEPAGPHAFAMPDEGGPAEMVPPLETREPRRPGGRGALVLLLLALAAGFVAWRIAGASNRPRTAPAVAAGDAYERAMSDARREHASARFAEAVAAYRRALTARVSSEAYEGLGRALRDLGDGPGALEALRRAIELDPRNASAYIALARMHVEAKRLDEARLAYQRYLAIEPAGSYADEAGAAVGAAR